LDGFLWWTDRTTFSKRYVRTRTVGGGTLLLVALVSHLVKVVVNFNCRWSIGDSWLSVYVIIGIRFSVSIVIAIIICICVVAVVSVVSIIIIIVIAVVVKGVLRSRSWSRFRIGVG